MIFGKSAPNVSVHTGRTIKRKRNAGRTVAIVKEPEDKMYRISFFNRRRMEDNSSVPFG